MEIGSEKELAAAISSANAPLYIKGGGTQGFSKTGDILDVSGMSGITLYEPGALTMVAKAGTPVADINAALARENQRLAFEPMDYRALLGTTGSPTIGGVIAANVSGPRRIAVGAARDFALGVRFVDGNGSIIKNGGRVMKNVTGYDLVKLMCGSFGTLGVLSEIAFKVLPQPETQATLELRGLSAKTAVTAMADAFGSPFEVTGAAHGLENRTFLRVEGFEDSVGYRIAKLQDLMAASGVDMQVHGDQASTQLWQGIRDVAPFHAASGDVWRVSCKPSDGPVLAERANAKGVLFDWAGGLVWFLTAQGFNLRDHLGCFDGHATLVKATPDVRQRLGVFHPEPPGVARLSKNLRARFDPRALFNPGLMDTELAVRSHTSGLTSDQMTAG